MGGVTHIQVQALLCFEDGMSVTISTPMFKKDIRNGDFFSKELTEQIIAEAGQGLASVVEHEGLEQMHYDIKRAHEKATTPRKNHMQPGYGDDFSPN